MSPLRRRFPVPEVDLVDVDFIEARSISVGDRIWHVNGLHEVVCVDLMRVGGEPLLVYAALRRTPAMRVARVPGAVFFGAYDEVLVAAR